MGSTEVKNKLRSHIAKLIDLKEPGFSDAQYWSLFWTLPTSVDDIVNAFSPSNIRHIRDTNIKAFARLLTQITYRLIYLTKQKNMLASEFPTSQLLNCVRLLTVILPFLYEKNDLGYIEDDIFWHQLYRQQPYDYDEFDINSGGDSTIGTAQLADFEDKSSQDSTHVNFTKMIHSDKLVGVTLVESCLDLLFTLNFTVESIDTYNHRGPAFANDYQPIPWEAGIEVPGRYRNPKLSLDSNRLEILRFMTVLFSKNMYNTIKDVTNVGSKFLTILVTATDGRKYYNLCISLLNTTIRSLRNNDEQADFDGMLNIDSKNHNGLDVPDNTHKKIRILMVANAIQLFTILIIYSIPKKDTRFLQKHNLTGKQHIRNRTRMFLGIIQETRDLKLLTNLFAAALFKPVSNTDFGAFSSIIKSSNIMEDEELHVWASEIVVMIMELHQCNPKFKAIFADLVGPKYLMVLLYYIFKFKSDKKYAGFLKLCVFNLLFFSSHLRLGLKLLAPVDMDFYDSLPQLSRISTYPASYRDYLIIKLCNCIGDEGLGSLNETILQTLHNLIGLHVILVEYNKKDNKEILANRRMSMKDISKSSPTQISYVASTSIVQLLTKLTSPNHLESDFSIALDQYALVLRACAQSIVRDPLGSIILLYVLSKNTQMLEKINTLMKKISNDRFNDMLQKETKEYQQKLQQLQNQNLERDEIPSPKEGIAKVDYEFSKRDRYNSKDSLDMPTLSRQTTQNTIESTPSIRSIPPISRQSSNISITFGSPTSTHYIPQEEAIDPMSVQPNTRTSMDTYYSADSFSDSNSEARTILCDENVFNVEMPVGMSERKKNKKPYYQKQNEKWLGEQPLKLIRDCIKAMNNEILNYGGENLKSQISDASFVIQKLLKTDLDNLFSKVSKPLAFDSSKTDYDQVKMKWNSLTLGWYVSLIWADIFLNYSVHTGKGLLAEISSSFSAIRKASSTWGFSGWKLGSISDNLPVSPLSNECTSDPERTVTTNIYDDNILKNSVWFGTHIILFRVNPQVMKEHYILQHGRNDFGHGSIASNNYSQGTLSFSDSIKRNSMSSPFTNLKNGSGVFTEGFWKRQGGRPNSLDRRDSDGSLKLQLSKGSK